MNYTLGPISLRRRTVLGSMAAIAAMPYPALARTCRDPLQGVPLVWRLSDLEHHRQSLSKPGSSLESALTALVVNADAALMRGPYTVTDKSRPPPSGDIQDYTSLGPYWWRDPDQPDGLPYIRRDGEINPERNGPDFDRVRMQSLIDDVKALGLAHWFTGQIRYAEHAGELLTVWFNDPDRRMNPNLNYGQSIPGRTDGRGIGIIDTHQMGSLIDAVQLLAREDGIDVSTYQGVRRWFADYTKWLVTSPLGQDERVAKNNHGTYYDLQLIHYALFIGDCDFARARLHDVKARIDSQISTYGRMPLEETRTRSLHYYIFNSLAFLQISRLAEHLGGDLYTYEGRRGQSLMKVLHYMAPFAGRESEWPHQQIGSQSDIDMAVLMLRAAQAYSDPHLIQASRRTVSRLFDLPQYLTLVSVDQIGPDQ